ncbi:MAG TPA: alpha/beta fold hydrolase [Acidimicrobiales bacterium]|nr:alpha/beta fold hydrolase [Acidimicrobiales bacterium]
MVTLPDGLRLDGAGQGPPGREPALVLLPGPTDSWRSYLPVLDHLPPDLRTVAFSARGHGRSDAPDPEAGHRYDVDTFAADVASLLDELGIRRAVLVGHSGSSLVARRVAIDHPEQVAGLVLESSPLTLAGDPDLRTFVEEVVTHLVDPIDPAFVRSFVTGTSSPDVDPDLLDLVLADAALVRADVWRATFRALATYDDRDELARIRAPVRLVWGDADPLVGRAVQDELQRLLPHASLRTFEGAGHTPRWEQPARFAAELVEAATEGPASTD